MSLHQVPTVIATSTATTTYVVGGIITSNGSAGAYGWIVGNDTTSTSTCGGTVYYGASSTPSNLALTLTSASTPIQGGGFIYNTGFAVLAIYEATSGFNYVAQTYYNTGLVNTSQVTIGSFATTTTTTQISPFTDVNGTFWIGYVIGDNTNGYPTQAWVGKFYNQIYPSNSNILATLTALLSFMIMSLFMF